MNWLRKMTKQDRQEMIVELIRAEPIRSQHELSEELADRGIFVNQSSISRDLSEIGVVKVDGVYRLPSLFYGEATLLDKLDIDTAGDNLIIVKTGIGQASMAGVAIDKAEIPEIAGTIAGDDSLFIAVRSRAHQLRAIKRIVALFQTKPGS